MDKPKKVRIPCSTCGRVILSGMDVWRHPVLRTLQCSYCHGVYNATGDLSKYRNGVDSDRHDNYCRWCLDGGDLLLCTDLNCNNGYCKPCITRNCGPKAMKKISESTSWFCFACDYMQLTEQRKEADFILNTLRPKISKPIVQSNDSPTKTVRVKNSPSKTIPLKNIASKIVQPRVVKPKDAHVKITPSENGKSKSGDSKKESEELQLKETMPKETQPKGPQLNEPQLKESLPKVIQLKESLPKVTQPKESLPKVIQLKESLPKVTQPKESLLKTPQPKESLPKVTQPKESLLKTPQPKESLPKVTQPKESLPKVSQPKESLPKTPQPKESLPKVLQPKESLPKVLQPKESLPKVTQSNEPQLKEPQPKTIQHRESQSKELQPKESEPKELQTKAIQSNQLQLEISEPKDTQSSISKTIETPYQINGLREAQTKNDQPEINKQTTAQQPKADEADVCKPKENRVPSSFGIFSSSNLCSKPRETGQTDQEDMQKILEDELFLSDDDSGDADIFVEAQESLDKEIKTNDFNLPEWATRDCNVMKKRLLLYADIFKQTAESFDENQFKADPERIMSWLSNVECFLKIAASSVDRCQHVRTILRETCDRNKSG